MENSLESGSLFKIEDKSYEFIGVDNASGNAEPELVARVDPDIPPTQGALHKRFSRVQIEHHATKIGPFGEALPYSDFVAEKEAWKNFFGKEIPIPFPPQQLIETMKLAKEQGMNSFEAHFLPRANFNAAGAFLDSKDTYPYPADWEVLRGIFWQEIYLMPGQGRRFEKVLNTLPGAWTLIDNTPKPDFQDGTQMYKNDPLGQILKGMPRWPGYPKESRFGFESNSLENHVFPQIEEQLKLPKGSVMLPSAVEYNIWANMFHPEFSKTSTAEVIRDKRKVTRSSDFVNNWSIGNIDDYGVRDITSPIARWQAYRGFRPMIVFPDVLKGGNK